MPRRPSSPPTTPGHGERAHARFSPSTSERWLACPHSIPFTEALVAAGTIPDPELDRGGEAAQRGTLAHEAAEAALRAATSSLLFCHPVDWIEAQVRGYLRAIESLNDELRFLEVPEAEITRMIEARVSLSADVWGSIDFALVVTSLRELWVIDLKTGHRAVPAEWNTQLMTYAAAIAKRGGWGYERAHLWIVQDEAPEPVAKWTCSIDALKTHARKCNAAVREAQRYDPRNPTFNTGDHCAYCPAKAHCLAQRAVVTSVFGDVASMPATTSVVARMPNPSELSPDVVARVLANEAQIRAWLDSVREHVLTQRPAIPGFKVVAARSRTTWVDEAEAMRRIRIVDASLIRQQLPTISAARSALPAALFTDLTTTPPGAPTIAPESDPRPALAHPGAVFHVEAPPPA